MTTYNKVRDITKRILEENPDVSPVAARDMIKKEMPEVKETTALAYFYKAMKEILGLKGRKPRVVQNKKGDRSIDIIRPLATEDGLIDPNIGKAAIAAAYPGDSDFAHAAQFYHACKSLNLKVMSAAERKNSAAKEVRVDVPAAAPAAVVTTESLPEAVIETTASDANPDETFTEDEVPDFIKKQWASNHLES